MIFDDYEITEYKKIVQVRTEWEMLFLLHNTSYCQSYNFMSYIERFCQENVFKKLFWGKLRYIRIKRNNECLLIAPFLLRGQKAYLLGEKAPVDYFGFVYANNSIESLEILLRYLKFKYRIKHINFGLLPVSQTRIMDLFYALSTEKYHIETSVGQNAALEYSFKSFDEYFKSLSKSVRQNYRTAINRSKTDGIEFSFEFYSEIPNSVIKRFLIDHKNRLNSRYSNGRPKIIETLLSPYRNIIYGKWRRDQPIYWSMKENKDHILCVAYLNKKPAAYFYGLISESLGKRRINFLRACVNVEEFGKYSPGIVLGIELIKHFGNNFDIYDFTIGNEQYKYQLGCKDFENLWTTVDILN